MQETADVFDIEKYLDGKKLVWRARSDQLNLKDCPFCGNGHWHLYASPRKFQFICFHCEIRGSFNKVLDLFGDTRIDIAGGTKVVTSVPAEREIVIPTSDPQDFNSNLYLEGRILSWLKDVRGFTERTVNWFKIGWNGKSITVPVFHDGQLRAYRLRRDPFLPDDTEVPKMKNEKGADMRLFNGDSLEGKESCSLTEGEFDAMALWQAMDQSDPELLKTHAVISGTLGAGNWKKEWTDRMAHLKRIEIWYDNDKAGNDGADKLAEALGVGRCHRVAVHGVKDANEFFAKGKTYGDYMASRKVTPYQTFPVKHLSEYVGEVQDYVSGVKVNVGIKTGFSKFDAIVGGFQPGHLIVLSGETSSGKTSYAVNIAYRIAKEQKLPVLYFSMEQQPVEMVNRLVLLDSRIAGVALRDRKFEFGDLEKIRDSLLNFKGYPIYFWDEPARLTMKRFDELLGMAIEKHGIRMVVVDHGLYFSLAASKESRATDLSDLVRFVKSTAQKYLVPVLLLWHTRRLEKDKTTPSLSDLRESSSVEKDADVVMFVIRNPSSQHAMVHVDKNRVGPTGKVKFNFNMDTTVFEEDSHAINVVNQTKDSEGIAGSIDF